MTRKQITPESQTQVPDSRVKGFVSENPDASRPDRNNNKKRMSSNKSPLLCPQQRYAKRPRHPGIVTLDSKLRQLPLQKDKGRSFGSSPSFSIHCRPKNCPENTSSHQKGHTFNNGSKDFYFSDAHNQSQSSSETVHAEEEDSNVSNSITERTNSSSPNTPERLAESMCDTDFARSLEHISLGQHLEDEDNVCSELVLDDSLLHDTWLETKLMYTGLISSNLSQAPVPLPKELELHHDQKKWQALDALRQALVLGHTYPDWFTASQASEPTSLKRLATRYGVCASDCIERVSEFMQHLRHMTQGSQERVLAFGASGILFLAAFRDVLKSSDECWLLVSRHLSEYLQALIHEGLTITPRTHEWEGLGTTQCDLWKRFKQSQYCPLDDDLRTLYLQQYPHVTVPPFEEVERDYQSTDLPLKNEVLIFMSGWLCFGPKIAPSFYHFGNVFRFLAWFGATYRGDGVKGNQGFAASRTGC